MLEIGTTVQDFTAPLAGGESYDDVREFRLSEATATGPVVLAFFPAAFTGGCTEELCTFRDSIARFEAADASVYGVSVDLPPAQNVFIQRQQLSFPLVSDFDRRLITQFDVVRPTLYGVTDVARRSVYVIDDDRITYNWVRPADGMVDYDSLVATVSDEVDALAK